MKESLKLRLNEIAKLEKNWDSYGGYPVEDVALRVAEALLEILEKAGIDMQPIPTADGGISLEWYGKENEELAFTIEPTGQTGIYVHLNDGREYSCSNNYPLEVPKGS